MLRLLVIFLAVIASSLAEDQYEKPDDDSLYIKKCCKENFGKPETKAISDECHKSSNKNASETAMCIYTKKGTTTPDGKLDMAKLNKYIEDEYETDPDLITAIKEACLEGDTSKYGRPDYNEFAKFINCEYYQLVMTCDDDDPCYGGGAFRFKKIE